MLSSDGKAWTQVGSWSKPGHNQDDLNVAANFKGKAQLARPVLVDGAMGVVVAPQGRLLLVLNLTFAGDRIASIDVVADPDRLEALDLSTLP